MTSERPDSECIQAVLAGDSSSFQPLVEKFSPRLFAMARRHVTSENEAQDLVQEIWLKAYQKLASFRGDAPFEHWLMAIGVRTCYDFLRKHRRSREASFTDLSQGEHDYLARFANAPDPAAEADPAALELLRRVLDQLPPEARLVITLLELEERSVKEVAQLTGWSVPLVKVRAFRARAKMKRILAGISREKYL